MFKLTSLTNESEKNVFGTLYVSNCGILKSTNDILGNEYFNLFFTYFSRVLSFHLISVLNQNFGSGISAVSSGIVPDKSKPNCFPGSTRKGSVHDLKRHMSDDFSTNNYSTNNFSQKNADSHDTSQSSNNSITAANAISQRQNTKNVPSNSNSYSSVSSLNSSSFNSSSFPFREKPVWRKENLLPQSKTSSENPKNTHSSAETKLSNNIPVDNKKVKIILFVIHLWDKIITLLPLYGPLFWTWYGYLIDDAYIVTPYGVGLCCEIFKKTWEHFFR